MVDLRPRRSLFIYSTSPVTEASFYLPQNQRFAAMRHSLAAATATGGYAIAFAFSHATLKARITPHKNSA